MPITDLTTPADLRRRALEVLVKELGYAEAMRFMHRHHPHPRRQR